MNFVNVNTPFFKSMSEKDQKVLKDAVTAFVAKQLELYLAGMESDVEKLKEYGVEVTYPDRDEFKAAGSQVIVDYRAKYPDFDAVMAKIEELKKTN